MSIKDFIARAEDGQASNQSQVWGAGQLAETLAWIKLAKAVLVDVAKGDGDSRDCRLTARDLVREIDL